MKEYLECGMIANTHGVRGAVLIESWCDTPEILAGLKTLYAEKNGLYLPMRVLRASVYKGRVMAELENVDTLEKASAWKTTTVYAKREDLPLKPGSFFVQDLIGLPVYDVRDGKVYGKLSDVENGSASELYEVETENGKFLIPAVPAFVKKVDLEKGIGIEAIEGMFE